MLPEAVQLQLPLLFVAIGVPPRSVVRSAGLSNAHASEFGAAIAEEDPKPMSMQTAHARSRRKKDSGGMSCLFMIAPLCMNDIKEIPLEFNPNLAP